MPVIWPWERQLFHKLLEDLVQALHYERVFPQLGDEELGPANPKSCWSGVCLVKGHKQSEIISIALL